MTVGEAKVSWKQVAAGATVLIAVAGLAGAGGNRLFSEGQDKGAIYQQVERNAQDIERLANEQRNADRRLYRIEAWQQWQVRRLGGDPDLIAE